MGLLRVMLSDPRKALVFARHILIETAWLALPVAALVLLARGSLVPTLTIAAVALVLGLGISIPLRLLVIEQKLRSRGRLPEQLLALSPDEFAVEIRKGWGAFGGLRRPK